MGTKKTGKMGIAKSDGLLAAEVVIERLRDELAREKDANEAYVKSIAYYRDEQVKQNREVDRLTNELGASKTKVGRLERMLRGLRDAFIAATEEDAATRPFSSTRG